MRNYSWNLAKNLQLQKQRGISFEEISYWIENGGLLDVTDHPNRFRYPGQRIFVVNVNDYVYLVPFVEDGENDVFLKTVIPSRKATRYYLKRSDKNENKTG
jgi:hypothetical protein